MRQSQEILDGLITRYPAALPRGQIQTRTSPSLPSPINCCAKIKSASVSLATAVIAAVLAHKWKWRKLRGL